MAPLRWPGEALAVSFQNRAVEKLDDRLVVDIHRFEGVEALVRGERGDDLRGALGILLQVCSRDQAGGVLRADDRHQLVGADPRDAVNEPFRAGRW